MSGFTEDEWGEFEFAIQHGDNETALKILETITSSADAGKAVQIAKRHDNQIIRTAAEELVLKIV